MAKVPSAISGKDTIQLDVEQTKGKAVSRKGTAKTRTRTDQKGTKTPRQKKNTRADQLCLDSKSEEIDV